MANVKAQINNVRLAPRNVRLVVNAVKGKNALKALEQLEFLNRRPSDPIMKLIKSALANAENNFNMVRSNLYIKEFYVDEGMKLRRYRPKAFGRTAPIQKKTSHIRLVLAEKVPGLKIEKKTEPKHEHKHDHEQGEHSAKEHKKIQTDLPGKPEVKTDLKENKGAFSSAKKKFFQRRKAI